MSNPLLPAFLSDQPTMFQAAEIEHLGPFEEDIELTVWLSAEQCRKASLIFGHSQEGPASGTMVALLFAKGPLPTGTEKSPEGKRKVQSPIPFLTHAGLEAMESDPQDLHHFNLRMPSLGIR